MHWQITIRTVRNIRSASESCRDSARRERKKCVALSFARGSRLTRTVGVAVVFTHSMFAQPLPSVYRRWRCGKQFTSSLRLSLSLSLSVSVAPLFLELLSVVYCCTSIHSTSFHFLSFSRASRIVVHHVEWVTSVVLQDFTRKYSLIRQNKREILSVACGIQAFEGSVSS